MTRQLVPHAFRRFLVLIALCALLTGGGLVALASQQPANVTPALVLTVNSAGDQTDANLEDNICDITGRGGVPYSGICTLRAAIATANRRYEYNGSSSSISFAAGVTVIQPATFLPYIDGPMMINGNAVELDGSLATGTPSGLVLEGGNSTVANLKIRNFKGDGIVLSRKGGNTIQDCEIRGNGGDGVHIFDLYSTNNNNTIVRNIIVQNTGNGILAPSNGNIIKGNKIGADGAQNLGNGGVGIAIGVSNNLVGAATGITPGGGPCAADCNLISGNGGDGISVSGISNLVQGNFIGVSSDGTAALPNHNNGITARGSDHTIAGNLISGNGVAGPNNTGDGIFLGTGAKGNIIRGNIIGANLAGTAALGNLGAGIRADYANQNIIGGDPGDPLPGRCDGDCNLIVGNSAGITIARSTRGANHVIGNFIGMDVNGSAKLPNQGDGVWVEGINNTIANNLISGNAGQGIHVYGVVVGSSTANTNTIQSNLIGVARDGITDMGNGGHGVWIYKSTNNIVGGTGYDVVNTIAFNRGKGVVVSKEWNATIGNRILGNAIHSNSSLGLDLNDDGVTQNDGTDADTGPNNLQNYPVLSGVTMNAPNVTLSGTLTSTVSTAFRLEFYANDTCDPSGYGEGKYYLGSADVTTNGSGRADFAVTLFNALSKHTFTATATDPDGNTSEFSMCAPPSILLKDSTPTTQIAPGQEIVYTLALTYTSGTGATVHGTLTDPLSQYTDYISGSLTWSRGQASYADGRVAWQGDLNDGQNVIVRYRVKVKGCEDLFAPDNWPRQIHNVVTAALGGIQLVADKDLELLKPDLVLTALEVTQGIQNLNHDVPLVTGRPSVVRAFVKAVPPPGTATCDIPTVRGRLTTAGRTFDSTGQTFANSDPPDDRPELEERQAVVRTLNFVLPADWAQAAGGKTVDVEVNPGCLRPDSNCANNTQSRTVTLVEEPPLTIYLYRVQWHQVPLGQWYAASNADGAALAKWIEAMFPVGGVEPRFRNYTYLDSTWVTPDTYTYAYVLVPQVAIAFRLTRAYNPVPAGAVALGYIGAAQDKDRPQNGYAYVGGRTAIVGTKVDGGVYAAAHELGHLFGLMHVDGKPDTDCSEPYQGRSWSTNSSYTHPEGRLSTTREPNVGTTFYGYNLARDATHSSQHYDLMTYCDGTTQWMSDYSWDKIRAAHPLGSSAMNAATAHSGGEYLVASGVISLTGHTAELGQVYRLPDLPAQPASPPGDFAVRLLSGTVPLATYPFTVPLDIEGVGYAPFVEMVPWVTGATRIEIISGTTTLAARMVSSHSPTATLLYPQGGETFTGTIPITWTAGDADGDALAFTILHSADNGQTWSPVVMGITDTTFVLNTTTISGSVQARVRVLATDGVNTAQATSAAFSVARNGPQAAIVSLKEGDQYPATQPLHLEGMAWDPEDGLLPSTNLTWTDSLSGVLGTGGSLYVSSLAQGIHTITLTARDGDGMTGAHEVRIFVGWRQYLPIVLRQ